jgi:DNA replication protein DnaC
VLDYYGSLDLLIIEEIGTGAGSDDERAKIFQVVNRRYEAMLPTVLVSNLDMDALKKEIGERVIDRMREGSRSLVVFDWQSHRGVA